MGSIEKIYQTNPMEYKTLESPFVKNKFRHTKIFEAGWEHRGNRLENWQIWQRESTEYQKAPHFELVCITRHDGYEIAGVKIEPSEVYPGASVWGQYGFTYTSEAQCFEKLDKILKAK